MSFCVSGISTPFSVPWVDGKAAVPATQHDFVIHGSPHVAYTCTDSVCTSSYAGNMTILCHCILSDFVQRFTVSYRSQLRFSHEILKITSCTVQYNNNNNNIYDLYSAIYLASLAIHRR